MAQALPGRTTDDPRYYDGSGGFGSVFDSNVPQLSPETFAGVDPGLAFVVNGKLHWAAVRHDLWEHAGVEASVMAEALDLYFLSPAYRDDAPDAIKLDDLALATSLPGSCKTILSCRNAGAPEKEKVWFFSRVLKRAVVITWDDTWWNGQRRGDGFYRRDGQRYVRFDEVAPAFGGTVWKDSRGLIWVDMPPRSAISGGEACAMQGQFQDCDIASFLLPEGWGTWGEENAFWLLGWQADTAGQDRVYRRIMSAKNIYGLKHGGNQPNALSVIGDAMDAASLIIPTLYLADEMASAFVQRYFPTQAMYETAAEREYRVAMELAAKVPAERVAKEAAAIVGVPVLPEGTRYAPGRGYYYIIRSMNRPPAEFQRDALDASVIPMPGYPGKWIVREFGLYEGGPLVDEYVCNYICDTKGNYDWIVIDNGLNAEIRYTIDPSWARRDMVTNLVKELRSHVTAAQHFADNGVKWVFESPKFRAAFEVHLSTYEPDLANQLRSFIHFIDGHL